MNMEWMPKLCALVMVLLLAAPAAVAADVTFADANLEAAVRDELGIPAPTPITEADMAGLTFVGVAGNFESPVTSLAGIEHASALQQVWFDYDTITDFSPLSGLPLIDIHLEGRNLTSLDAFRSHADLQSLDLTNTQIGDVGDVTVFSNLVSLSLVGQNVDLSGLFGHTSLVTCYVADSGVTDLSPLADETAMTILGVPGNSITDLNVISGMIDLHLLNADNNAIRAIPDMSAILQLSEVSLRDNQITDIEPLMHVAFAEVATIDLRGNPLNEMAYSTYLPQLEGMSPNVRILYDPVPEPATIAFLCAAAVLGVSKRGRQRIPYN